MYSETDIIKPAIDVIRSFGGECSTTDLRLQLKKILDLDEYDLQTLPSSDFTRIDQIIRNLKSNRHFERLGLATHTNGGFALTQKGLTILPGDIDQLVADVIRRAPRATNTLSIQQAMFAVVKELGIKFKDSKKVANIFRSGIEQLSPQNDNERLDAARLVIGGYIENNPHEVV